MPSFTIVAASRLRAEEFYVKSALGRSLTAVYANFPVKRKISAGQSCKLLDDVFLASKKSILETNGIRFDEMFDFHFYDLDFCRQGEQKNLRMGTIPLIIIHESGKLRDTAVASELR